MNIGTHRARDNQVNDTFLVAMAESRAVLNQLETHVPTTVLTPDDETMLRRLEESDGVFINHLVDEVWDIQETDTPNTVELEENLPLSELAAMQLSDPAELSARAIVRDWAWAVLDVARGTQAHRLGCLEHFPRQCHSFAEYDLVLKVLDLDIPARENEGCRPTGSQCHSICWSTIYSLCLAEASCRSRMRPTANDTWASVLAYDLAPWQASAPSRWWSMIDAVAKTFRVETYDPENVLRMLFGVVGKQLLFAGLTNRMISDERSANSWSEPEILKDVGASFIEYFREWSRVFTATHHNPLSQRDNVFQAASQHGCGVRTGIRAQSSTVLSKSPLLPAHHGSQTREVQMPRITFYPLSNADTILIDLANGKKVLFDYAHMQSDNEEDKRIDLREALWRDLKETKRAGYDIFAVTHLDNDHTAKADEFFYLDHAKKYQKSERATIGTLWIPAGVIVENQNDLNPGGRALQAEARYRLIQGYGIRIFSRPQLLKGWLEAHGIRLADREHLITDAGNVAPGLSLSTDGVEFFVHSPFAWRQDEDDVIDRNGNSLVMQATFSVNGALTRTLLGSDVDHEALSLIVKTTQRHKRESRLLWDIFKLPHHCSYLTLGPERGIDVTDPVMEVRWLFEKQAQRGCIIVSTSEPIPQKGSAEDESTQPPHRQAAIYYTNLVEQDGRDGEFKVTMQHPKASAPKPLIIEIDSLGHRVKKEQIIGAAAAASTSAPRAG